LCSKCSQQIVEEDKSLPFSDTSKYSGGHVGYLPSTTKTDFLQKVVVPLTVLTIVATICFSVKRSLAVQFFKAGWNFFMQEWTNLQTSILRPNFNGAFSLARSSYLVHH